MLTTLVHDRVSLTFVQLSPLGAKVAVTDVAAVMLTVQVPVPLHAPDQPENIELAFGAAVSTTLVAYVNDATQALPQLMPVGVEVTVPVPVPAFPTVRVYERMLKVAVTVAAAETAMVQAPVPLHPPPLQPAKDEPAAAAAVSTRLVPGVNEPAQVAPQLMPAGAEVTVPVPVPAFETVMVTGFGLNVAVTPSAVLVETVHVPVPVQPPPLQPANVEPVAGVAVRTTDIPGPYASLQSVGQLMPAGADTTVPTPVPASVTTTELLTAKEAWTVTLAVAVTAQLPVPVHPPPDQPTKSEPDVAVACSVTVLPLGTA